jgi:chromosome segregation ATPase
VDTSRCIRRAALSLLLCCVAGPVLAQTARGGGESQRFMQQYQQLATEKTALEAQVASLKHDLEAARTELATAQKERDALKARSAAAGASVTQLGAAKEAAEKTNEQTRQQMSELVTHFRETANNLKQVETDREQLRGQLREGSAAYDRCATANLSLYELDADILNRYEHVGWFTRVSASEPFTRITRARMENLVDETRARALDLREKSTRLNVSEKAAGTPPHP